MAKTAKALKVNRSEAVALIVALGVKTAGNWDDKKLLKALTKDLENIDDGSVKLTKPEQSKLLKSLKAANKDETPVELVTDGKPAKKAEEKTAPAKATAKGGKKAAKEEEDEDDEDDEESEDEESEDEDEEESDDEESDDEESEDEDEDSDDEDDSEESEEEDEDESEGDDEEEEEEEEAPKSKKKPPLKKKAANKDEEDEKPAKKKDKGDKKKSAPKADSAEKDKFGMREGTRAARINKAITHKSKSVKQIMEDADYDKTIHSHLRVLMENGHVKKDENGYYDVKARKEKAKGKK